MKHLFLSDVHLGAFTDDENERLEKDLISLIEYAIENKIHLHILGDLFDYWMEFGATIPNYGRNVLDHFENYNLKLAPATYITGNHDNWTLGYFKKIGFDVHSDFKELNTGAHSFFLHHGDGLADPEYNLQRPLVHKVLRHPLFTSAYRKIFNPDTGIDLMKQFSEFSRANPDQKPDRLNRWSKSFLKNTAYDFVVSGHDHIARVETFSFGTYINLGTFYGDKTVALYNNNQLSLVRWDAEYRQLKTVNTLHE